MSRADPVALPAAPYRPRLARVGGAEHQEERDRQPGSQSLHSNSSFRATRYRAWFVYIGFFEATHAGRRGLRSHGRPGRRILFTSSTTVAPRQLLPPRTGAGDLIWRASLGLAPQATCFRSVTGLRPSSGNFVRPVGFPVPDTPLSAPVLVSSSLAPLRGSD
jgi:hypothetical protein